MDLTEIMVDVDNPVNLCQEKILVGYKTDIGQHTYSTNHDFIKQSRLRSVVFLPWERNKNGHLLCWLWSNDRRLFINGEFQWPSARMDIFKNKHGATLFWN